MDAILFLWISLILLIFALGSVKAFTADSFILKPEKEVYSEEGSDVTLEWHFHVGSWSSSLTNGVFEFLFGVWDDPGFVRNKILAVQERNAVSKRREFERKVDWSGNIYDCVNCTARVKMYNLTDVDFKKYGVEVELSLDRRPLTNWVTLVKFVPAEILKWPLKMEVEEGNATTIECEAKGRPTPSVIIKKRNRTLCHNSTGHCVYEIREAKPEDEGEYLCLVQQRNYSQKTSSSLNLTVLEGRNISAIDTNAVFLTAVIVVIFVEVVLTLSNVFGLMEKNKQIKTD
ncbi:uncharacterized protein LOC116309097 [Actinia tenebrosa]|uniref:Uncharacterized protein LOC116309097 n=1 Tax=Actinia tenebrosa TaxID=6105 RepID=A0A6P8J6T6_ACTTE|nr:uncharacterized protein LOC116309097 [Actinia tenebrosa]